MPGRLEGKVCVITGAAGGIGAESARAVRRARARRVVGVDLADGGRGELALEADVTDEEQVARACTRGRATSSAAIDVLFNNAGINPTDDALGRSTPRSRPGSGSRTSTCAASSSAASTASRTCSTPAAAR